MELGGTYSSADREWMSKKFRVSQRDRVRMSGSNWLLQRRLPTAPRSDPFRRLFSFHFNLSFVVFSLSPFSLSSHSKVTGNRAGCLVHDDVPTSIIDWINKPMSAFGFQISVRVQLLNMLVTSSVGLIFTILSIFFTADSVASNRVKRYLEFPRGASFTVSLRSKFKKMETIFSKFLFQNL